MLQIFNFVPNLGFLLWKPGTRQVELYRETKKLAGDNLNRRREHKTFKIGKQIFISYANLDYQLHNLTFKMRQ